MLDLVASIQSLPQLQHTRELYQIFLVLGWSLQLEFGNELELWLLGNSKNIKRTNSDANIIIYSVGYAVSTIAVIVSL